MNKKIEGDEEFTPLDESDVEGDYPESGSEDASDDEEETENSETDEESDDEEETETESEENEDKGDDKPEKVYYFNGREMSADELYKESSLLQTEFTKKSQKLSEIEKTDDKKDVLSEYDDDEVKRFGELAKAMGFVKKDELEHQQKEDTQNSILKTFVDKHPEYNNKANSDKLFKELKSYSTDLNYLEKNLEKAHKDLFPETTDDSEKKQKVNEVKNQRQGVGVNSGKKAKSSSGNHTPDQIKVMKEMGVWEE